MSKVTKAVVGAASVFGEAYGAFIKAKEQILRKPDFISGLAQSSAWDGGDFGNQDQAHLRAVRNTWFFTGVNKKALDLSGSKFNVYYNPSGLEDEGEVAEAHPFLKILRRPNPYMGKSFLMQYTEWWLDLKGEAYWFIEPDGNNGIKGIWPLPANKMDIEFTDDFKSIKRYVLKTNMWYYLDPRYVVQFKFPNPWDFFRGLAPLISFILTIDADLAMKMWNGSFFGKDNVMPSAVIALGSGDPNNMFEQSDIDGVKAELQNEYSAIKRKTVITNANTMSVALLGYNAKDMDFLSGMAWNKDEILLALGVPPGMVDKNATEANAKVGMKDFKDVMWSIKNLIADEVTVQVLQVFYNEALELRPDDDRIYDREAELAEFDKAKEVMTEEELREKFFQLPPLTEGQVSLSAGRMQARQAQEDANASKEDSSGKDKNSFTSNTIPSKDAMSKKNYVLERNCNANEQEAQELEELQAFRTKAHNRFKQGKLKSIQFSSDVLDKDTIKSIISDLQGAEKKSDIDDIFAHYSFTKGGKGSGENDGHPFRGNQWTSGIEIAEKIKNMPETEHGFVQSPFLDRFDYEEGLDAVTMSEEKPYKKTRIKISEIIPGNYGEENLRKETLLKLSNVKLNPLDVVVKDGKYYLKDGNHRMAIAYWRGQEDIEVNLYRYNENWQPEEKSLRNIKSFSYRPWSFLESSLTQLIYDALQSVFQLLLDEINETSAQDDELWKRIASIMSDSMKPSFTQIADKASQDMKKMLGSSGLTVSFEMTNSRAREWALLYAAEQIKGIDNTTKKAVQRAIAEWIDAGRNNGIQGLKDKIMALADLNGIPLFSLERAERIARSEATSVYAGATEAALVANGYPPAVYKPRAHVNCRCYIQPGTLPNGSKVIIWYTVRDEMVCEMELETPFGTIEGCKNLHRVIVSEGHAGEKWTGNLWNPDNL